MPRKSADLLELFRPAAPRGAPSAEKRASSSGRAGGGGGEVVLSLSRRQAWLVGSATVLAVVLAFVAGIGLGRGRKAPDGGPAAARMAVVPYAFTSAPIPRAGLRGEDLVAIALADFLSKYPIDESRVSVVPPTDARSRDSGARCLRVRGFTDRVAAQNFLFQVGAWWLAGAGSPFQTSVVEVDR